MHHRNISKLLLSRCHIHLVRIITGLFFWALPIAAQAEFTYTTNSPDTNTVTITGYTGSGGEVVIPSNILNKTVTSIGDRAFMNVTDIINVSIGNSITNIGEMAFAGCFGLTGITIGSGVITIGKGAFRVCISLASATIPDSVTTIGYGAFIDCVHMTNIALGNGVTTIEESAFGRCAQLSRITIPNSVTNIENNAFRECAALEKVYFSGNAANIGSDVFLDTASPTIYHLPNTSDWPTVPNLWANCPTALWLPEVTDDGSSGVQDEQFGFNIVWASGQTVVVEASTNLTQTNWVPVVTNTLTNGTFYFSDPQWTNYPSRFYRERSQ